MPTTCPYHYLTHLKCNSQHCAIRNKYQSIEIMDQKYFFMLKEIYETNPSKRNQINIILKEMFTQFSPNGMIALYESMLEMKNEGILFDSCKKRKIIISEVLHQVDQYKINRKQTNCEVNSNSKVNKSAANSSTATCKFIHDSNNYYSNVADHETNPLKRRLSNTSSYTTTSNESSFVSSPSPTPSNSSSSKKRKLSPKPQNRNVFETITHYSTSSVVEPTYNPISTHNPVSSIVHYNLPEFNPPCPRFPPNVSTFTTTVTNNNHLQLNNYSPPPKATPTLQKLPSLRELMDSIMYSSMDGSSLLLKKVFE